MSQESSVLGKNGAFAERHPVVNAIIGLIILIITCIIGLRLIKSLFNIIWNIETDGNCFKLRCSSNRCAYNRTCINYRCSYKFNNRENCGLTKEQAGVFNTKKRKTIRGIC